MRAADELVDVVRTIVQNELDKRDSTVLCRVASKKDDLHYNVYVVPDQTALVSDVVNMTKFDLNVGDYCYVYKIGGSYTNCFICYKI